MSSHGPSLLSHAHSAICSREFRVERLWRTREFAICFGLLLQCWNTQHNMLQTSIAKHSCDGCCLSRIPCGCWVPSSLACGRLEPCFREEQWETCRGGQTTQKANIYLGDFWTSLPAQVWTFSLMTYHWEVSSEAQVFLRRSRYSSPHLAPYTASCQMLVWYGWYCWVQGWWWWYWSDRAVSKLVFRVNFS